MSGPSPDEVLALEAAAALGWVGLESAWLGPPGQGWLLRAAEGFTGRANSVLPLGDPGMPLREALDEAEAWYRGRGLVPLVQLPLTAAPQLAELAELLDARGYSVHRPTRVLVADLSALAPADDETDGLVVRLDPEPDDAWLAAYHYRGMGLPPVARRVLLGVGAGGQRVFVSVRQGADVLAIARGAAVAGWTGLAAMEVAPSARRRGLATRVVRTLAAWGVEQRCPRGYLQVDVENTAARALYQRLGYVDHHGYLYRRAE